MAKSKKHPRYNVVSVRVSDEERELLEKLSAEENKKVSELIREALQSMAADGQEEEKAKPSFVRHRGQG